LETETGDILLNHSLRKSVDHKSQVLPTSQTNLAEPRSGNNLRVEFIHVTMETDQKHTLALVV